MSEFPGEEPPPPIFAPAEIQYADAATFRIFLGEDGKFETLPVTLELETMCDYRNKDGLAHRETPVCFALAGPRSVRGDAIISHALAHMHYMRGNLAAHPKDYPEGRSVGFSVNEGSGKTAHDWAITLILDKDGVLLKRYSCTKPVAAVFEVKLMSDGRLFLPKLPDDLEFPFSDGPYYSE